MANDNGRVLVINPGSTSTKFGVYARQGAEKVWTIRHGDEELARFRGQPMVARLDYRAELIENALEEAGYSSTGFAATAGRGGLLPPMECGTYLVDEAMVEELRLARRGRARLQPGSLAGAPVCQGRRGERVYRRPGDGGRVAGVRAALPVRRWLSATARPRAEHQGRGAEVCAGTESHL